jgi:hypothetical protein
MGSSQPPADRATVLVTRGNHAVAVSYENNLGAEGRALIRYESRYELGTGRFELKMSSAMSHEPSGWRAQTSMNFPESVCVSRPPAKGGHSRLPKRCARIVLANWRSLSGKGPPLLTTNARGP